MTLLGDIAEHAEALCDPRHHFEPIYGWSPSRNRIVVDRHRTVVPGLLAQLEELAEPGADGQAGGHGGMESCPAAIGPVSLLAAVTFGAAYRCSECDVAVRDTVAANIRALVGVAGRLDSDRQDILCRELCSWRRQAEILTGWRTPATSLKLLRDLHEIVA